MVSIDLRGVVIPVPDLLFSEDHLPCQFCEAISKLKGGKAVGICSILAELLKSGGKPMACGLQAVLSAI